MKTLGKILVLLTAWCLLVGATYPVSWTPWAESVRVMVREARAKRMAKMPPQQGPKPTAQAPGGRKGPRAKVPNLSLASFLQIREFLIFTLIPCVLTILLRKCFRRKIA